MTSARRPRYLSDDDVRECLAGVDLQPALENAVRALQAGVIQSVPRAALGRGPRGQITHIMAAKNLVSEEVVTKLVDYDPRRPQIGGRPSLCGVVTYMVAGDVHFVADASFFTNLRTAAATAMAVDLMSEIATHVLTIFGAGPLAKEHALAMARKRDLSEIRIVSLSGRTAELLANELSKSMRVPIKAMTRSREACSGATIVVTVTSAVEPILFDHDLEAGTLVAAVGSGTPERRELDGPLIGSASKVVVETVEAAESEAGDLIAAHREGYLDWKRVTPVAEMLHRPDRVRPSSIAVYKSVGAAWQDLACASVLAERLRNFPMVTN